MTDQVLDDFITSKPQAAGVVSWSPPQVNWNPWIGCNIDDGPLATQNLDEISENLHLEQRENMMNNHDLLESINERSKLPANAMKSKIMTEINENPVIIIRGNTGCGKTTQVSKHTLKHNIYQI